MKKLTLNIAGDTLSLRGVVTLAVLAVGFCLLTACSALHANDLAVQKMSREQQRATAYLPLNADKPGTDVNVLDYLVPGKFTIVEYFSPYCATCMNMEPGLIQLAQGRNDIAVRTVNINRPDVQGIDWQSPIMQNEQIGQLPYIRIYEPNLRLRAHGRPAYEQILQMIKYPAE